MISADILCKDFMDNEIDFFTGVPDSYLNAFCNYLLDNYPDRNVIAANEGNAVAIASGYYIATGKIPLVYMQNSGIGNAVNPLASLADYHVYDVPLILLIGWRGQPGTDDWEQHICQGAITIDLLKSMGIPHRILSDDEYEAGLAVKWAVKYAKNDRKTCALLVPKGVFSGNKANNKDTAYPLSRSEAIETVVDYLPQDIIYSATTGRASRELFFLREKRKENIMHDFLNVGAMGHTSSVALGMALAKPGRQFVVFDGDSAVIMHMGALTMVSKLNVPNFLHIVLNNGAHESVGGQPSAGHRVNFTQIADACGYATVGKAVTSKKELEDACSELFAKDRAGFIEVKIHKGLSGSLPPLDFLHRKAIEELRKELKE